MAKCVLISKSFDKTLFFLVIAGTLPIVFMVMTTESDYEYYNSNISYNYNSTDDYYTDNITESLIAICPENVPERTEPNQTNYILLENLDEDSFSEHFLSCDKIELELTDFCAINGTTVFSIAFKNVYYNTNYYVHGKNIAICVPFSTDVQKDEKEDKVAEYLTLIGISISNVCLALHFLAFVLIPEMKNLPGKNLASLTIAVFFSFTFFLASPNFKEHKPSCICLAALVYYFFVSSFLWMNAIGFETWRSLRMASTELRLSTKRMENKRYIHYCIYGWFVPIMLVCIIFIIDNIESINEKYRPGFGEGRVCWFSQTIPLMIFFITPLAFVMLSNILFFVCSAFIIYKHTRSSTKQTDYKYLVRKFTAYCKLAVVTGLTWISGVTMLIDSNIAGQYVFVILSTFYGFFIFISFTLTRTVIRHIGKRFIFVNKWLSSMNDTEDSKT